MQISPAATNSPSSSKEVDVVLSYISANNRCDITAVLAHLDDDIRVIGPSGGFLRLQTQTTGCIWLTNRSRNLGVFKVGNREILRQRFFTSRDSWFTPVY